MSRTKGTYTLTSNIEAKVGAPLDARTIVKLKADLITNGTFDYPYKGLTVFVEEDNKKYTLIGADPTVLSNWIEESSGGGHTIEKSDGTDMTQRTNLQFLDAQISDDSTNDRTKIENIKVISSESQLSDLPDGIYMGSTDEENYIGSLDVTYNNTTSGLTATNVQDAIDEIAQNSGSGSADDITYDNTDSGLEATNVQDAIDEIVDNMGSGAADDITYDNTDSGLTATNVQDAIDEVMDNIGSGGHTIEKSDGTDMTQRTNLQFLDAQISDDSTNDRTKIENIKVISSESQLSDLPDGLYIGSTDETNYITALDVTYNNTESGLSSTTVQDAIDELSNGATSGSADDITYDNTDSGLTATNVQDAIDEVMDNIGSGSADDITYDNTDSGLAATNVQDAIDEVVDNIGSGGHTIEKSDGTDMTQRTNLQFLDAQISDDSTNDRTKIENIKVISSESQLSDLPDGLYIGSTDEMTYVTALDVTYNNTESGLSSTTVQDAIDELKNTIVSLQNTINQLQQTINN